MMKALGQNGLSALISRLKQWVNDTFIKQTDTEQTTVLSIDSTPTKDSNNLVTSGGVKAAIDASATALTAEAWTFTLTDGSTVTKQVVIK